MASKIKTTVALPADLLEAIDEESEKRDETRSSLIEEAIRFWKHSQIEQALKKGYAAMAEEDLKTAKKHLPLMKEVLR